MRARSNGRFAARNKNVRAAGIGFGVVALLGFVDGGYFESSWPWAILVFLALAGLARLTLGVASGPLERTALASFLALAAWTALSGLWGIPGAQGMQEAERTLVYAVALAALLALVDPTAIRALLVGVAGGTVVLASFGLGHRMLEAHPPNAFEGGLLIQPLGYANALGIVVAIGIVLAVGLMTSDRRPLALAFRTTATIVLVLALALTSSRGAVLALGVGLAVTGLMRALRARVNRSWMVIGASACIAIVFVLLVALRPDFGDRPAYWKSAIADVRDHPVLGSGAGSFDNYWYSHTTVEIGVQDAHSVYLEALAELGPLGLLLVLVALGLPVVAGVVARSNADVSIAAGGYAAFLAHAGIDWDWEMPTVTLTGLACGAGLLIAARPRTSGTDAADIPARPPSLSVSADS